MKLTKNDKRKVEYFKTNLELEQEIKRLTKRLEEAQLAYLSVDEKNRKAIEYLESYNTDFKNCRFGEAPISLRELGDLLDILKGSDKE